MRAPRKTALTLCVATALLATACSSRGGPEATDPSGSDDGSSETSGSVEPPPDAPALEPLPEEIPADLQPYYEQELSWSACGGGYECATLTVPLDYENPGGGDMELRVTRSAATNPDQRIGALLMNPGGPGASAVDFTQSSAEYIFPSEVLARYDMAAIDPRGTGGSQPVECLDGPAMDEYTLTDRTPDDEAEEEELLAAFDEFATACAENSGTDLLSHISTIETARDMDVFRAALGDDQLHYLGFSYGTKLGAVYAGLYPQRVGRLVLDAAIDPRLPTLYTDREQSGGFETAFRSFAEDCASFADCPLGIEGADEASDRLSAFFEQVDGEPLPTGDDRQLTESLATTGVANALYAEFLWPDLRQALSAAINDGDGAALLSLADDYNERGPDGSYGSSNFAFPAISCLDSPAGNADVAELESTIGSFEDASPTFGRDFAWATLLCAAWPVEPTGEPVSIAAEGASDILVVGTLRDPATPYAWAEGLAEQLSSGVLLTYDGDGHGAYGGNSPCVDSAVNRYLLENTSPEDGTTCS